MTQFSPQCEDVEKETFKPVSLPNNNPKTRIIAGSVIALSLVILGIIFIPRLFISKEQLEKSIAVLPFLNESPVDSNKYFINGIMEEVLNNLQKIKDFRVLSRTSTDQYKGPDIPTIPEIAKKLNVNYIVEGSGQKVGNKFRLRVQLIKAERKENQLWANSYEQEIKEIFVVQNQIAESIAAELKVVIKPEEKILLNSVPTLDLTAHDYYLRGKDYQNRSVEEADIRYAIGMYKKAVEIDSSFVLAWVGLATCSRSLYWYSFDISKENLSSIRKYLDKALSLSPNLKEVRTEEAWYYYQCKLEYSSALEKAYKLKIEDPSDDEIYFLIACIYRRIGMEEYKKSLENSENAISLNPSYWRYWSEAALTCEAIREYTKGEIYYKRAIDINPSNSILYSQLFSNYINSGQIQKAKEFLLTHEKFFDSRTFNLSQAQLEIIDRNYYKAIQIYQSLSEDAISEQQYYFTKHQKLGQLYLYVSKFDSAAYHFEMEKNFLLQKIMESGYDQRIYRSLGIAFAGLGMKMQALKAINKTPEILDFAVAGVCEREMDKVRILVMVGETDKALTRLNQIIKNIGLITIESLKQDPFWDSVRNENKFKEIISNPAYQTIL